MSTVNKTNEAVAQQSAKNAEALPAGLQYAITVALPNCINGAFWGFADEKAVLKRADAIKQDKNIRVYKLENACLVEVNPDYLIKTIQSIGATTLLTKEDITKMQKHRVESEQAFIKMLVTKGASTPNFSTKVGIYCVNDTTAITHNGVSYPAFTIDIGAFLNDCSKYNYAVNVEGKWLTPNEASNYGGKIFNSFILSPTWTGVFAEIKAMGSPDWYKEVKRSFSKK